jgi:hypothetical protein
LPAADVVFAGLLTTREERLTFRRAALKELKLARK